MLSLSDSIFCHYGDPKAPKIPGAELMPLAVGIFYENQPDCGVVGKICCVQESTWSRGYRCEDGTCVDPPGGSCLLQVVCCGEVSCLISHDRFAGLSAHSALREKVPGTGEVARFPAKTLGTHKDGNTEDNVTSTGSPTATPGNCAAYFTPGAEFVVNTG
jgi:hypothetical protein